jgi:hypothetical protein
MTQFNKSDFNYYDGYLTYKGTFIARFKYRGPITKAKFIKELVKNHTVESYVQAYFSGKAPVTILKDKNPTWHEKIVSDWKSKQIA